MAKDNTYRVATGIKSIAPATNWFRVKGTSPENCEIEAIAVFAVMTFEERELKHEVKPHPYGDIIVGVPARDFSVIGVDSSEYIDDVAGYVQIEQTEIDPNTGKRVLKAGVANTLTWE